MSVLVNVPTAVIPVYEPEMRAEATVPLDKLDAFNVVKFAPDTAPNEPDHVPVVIVPTPVIPVYEPDKRADARVPEVMFVAFVVSVVADAARPVTKEEGTDPAVNVPTAVIPV